MSVEGEASVEIEEIALALPPKFVEEETAPEVTAYLMMLTIASLLKAGDHDQAQAASDAMVELCMGNSRTSMLPLSAKAYAFQARCNELRGNSSTTRASLLDKYRTACLRHDELGQATLINLLLRSYLDANLYEQALKLITNCKEFPEAASNNQYVRYLYYVGRIQAVQLDYSEAHQKLSQALRKAPQKTARGFQIATQQLSCVVQLLMGDIPDRSCFGMTGQRDAMKPYLELTMAVRGGELAVFTTVLDKYSKAFENDRTLALVRRLRHSVIKTGLRKINVSYSKISLADICAKLHLENAEDAQYVCAKAIRDGVIDAVIDHDDGTLKCKEVIDVYSTTQPQAAFHERISFCLDVRNDAVKSMRYPPDAYKKTSSKEQLEREKEEEELKKEIQDELDEDDAEDAKE